jgi:hypothetical protein
VPDTLQAATAVSIALLPGALYLWAFERQAGRWGVGLGDRAFRFVGGSALFHVTLAPLGYWLWSTAWPLVRTGRPLTPWLWPAVAAYAVVPLVAGSAVGVGAGRRARWARWFTGPNPVPRAGTTCSSVCPVHGYA